MFLDPIGQDSHFDGNEGPIFPPPPPEFVDCLIEACQEYYVVYTHDLDGRITYMGPSAKGILNIEPTEVHGLNIKSLLSDCPENELIRNNEWSLLNSPIRRHGTCELIVHGCRHMFQYWRVLNPNGESQFQVSGIIGRIHLDHSELELERESTDKQLVRLLSRAASLTEGERNVVHLIVDGHFNKKVARLLNVSMRTVESRRSKAMKKLGAITFSELVQFWILIRTVEGRNSQKSSG